MTTLLPADPCAPAAHIPDKTERESRLEQLLRECLPYVLAVTCKTDKTEALIQNVLAETRENPAQSKGK